MSFPWPSSHSLRLNRLNAADLIRKPMSCAQAIALAKFRRGHARPSSFFAYQIDPQTLIGIGLQHLTPYRPDSMCSTQSPSLRTSRQRKRILMLIRLSAQQTIAPDAADVRVTVKT